MNLHERVKIQLRERKERLEKGYVNSIPFPFKALNKYVPGIMPETQYGLTTISGAGKSLFSTHVFVQNPFDYWRANKDKMDIDVKIFMLCLEDSVDMTMKRMQIRALYEQFGMRMSMFKLNSYFEEDKLDDESLLALDKLDPYFNEFLSKVELIDNIRSPKQIYFKIKEWLERPENGCIVDENGNKLTERQQKEAHEAFHRTYYKPSHPNRFVVVVVDNIQNIKGDGGDKGKWNALDFFCRELMRDGLVSKYKVTSLLIAQQEKSKEKAQYTNDGDVIAEKHVPSIDGIAEYKNVVDSCHCLFGLYYPWKYRVERYPTEGHPYEIDRIQDFYRNLHILKSNFAETNLNTSLFFDGITGVVSELPYAGSKEMQEIYRYVEDLQAAKQGLKPLKLS